MYAREDIEKKRLKNEKVKEKQTNKKATESADKQQQKPITLSRKVSRLMTIEFQLPVLALLDVDSNLSDI